MRSLVRIIVGCFPAVALGWGFDGHRRLSSMLQDPLPANHCLKGWFASRQTTALQNHSCDPDRWRISTHAMYDPNEAPRHYLEVDRVSPPSGYPRDWNQVMALFPQYHTLNGRVPWRVEEMYAQLVAAFASRDSARVLDVTFVMSHYVTDAFSVLHDTRDFNPGGVLHSRWESDMLSVNSQIDAITTAARGYFGTPGRADPRHSIFDIVLVGQGYAAQLTSWHFANPTDDVAFFNAAKDLTARRWGDAVTLLASLIWSAWVDAGSPALTGFAANCSTAAPVDEVVLKGYPPPGGFTHPDGGSAPMDSGVVVVDAGHSDAGCLDGCGDDGGTGGNAGGSGGAGGQAGAAGGAAGSGGAAGGEPPPGGGPCGCHGVPLSWALGAVWILARRARR